MPVNTFRCDRDLGDQVWAREGDALRREAAQRNVPDHAIFCGDPLRIEKSPKLLGLRVSGYCRSQSDSKTFRASALYAHPSARPGALTAMRVVALRSRAIEADLNRYAIAWQRE